MTTYQLAMIEVPRDWQPRCPDDVPPGALKPLEVTGTWEELFPAVRQAIEHNEQGESERGGRWALVVDSASSGKTLPAARLCTPITYRVIPIWWPDGWEPESPLDVPNCVSPVRDRADERRMTYRQAVAAVNGLNRQCMDQPDTTWYVVTAIENEPALPTDSPDRLEGRSAATRPVHVIRPERGGRGDCSHCPAHNLPCAEVQWTSRQQTRTSR